MCVLAVTQRRREQRKATFLPNPVKTSTAFLRFHCLTPFIIHEQTGATNGATKKKQRPFVGIYFPAKRAISTGAIVWRRTGGGRNGGERELRKKSATLFASATSVPIFWLRCPRTLRMKYLVNDQKGGGIFIAWSQRRCFSPPSYNIVRASLSDFPTGSESR